VLGEQAGAEVVHPRSGLFSSSSLSGLERLEYCLGSILVDQTLGDTNHSIPNEGRQCLPLVSCDYLEQGSLVSWHAEADGRGLAGHWISLRKSKMPGYVTLRAVEGRL
jgi:hypothetical protein